MSGECDKCSEHCLDFQCDLIKGRDGFVKKLIEIGIIREKIKNITKEDFFKDLSKHNPYFESKYTVECDKLYDLRMFLSGIESTLYDILEIIDG